MLRALHAVGLEASAKRRASWEQLAAAPKPALVGRKLSATVGHVALVLATEGDGVTVGDPLMGEMTYTRNGFLESWDRELIVAGWPESAGTAAPAPSSDR